MSKKPDDTGWEKTAPQTHGELIGQAVRSYEHRQTGAVLALFEEFDFDIMQKCREWRLYMGGAQIDTMRRRDEDGAPPYRWAMDRIRKAGRSRRKRS